jgi:hypothetical protein
LDAADDLREAITRDEQVEVEGRRYRKLESSSSATCHSRWGSHHVEEALCREVGVHNDPRFKPIELRVGIVEHITPDMARIVGESSADRSSRGVERTLAWRHPVGRSSRGTRRRWASRSPTKWVRSNRSRATPRPSPPTGPR